MRINGKKIQLTKEQAIEGHRKMWNWIADQYMNGRIENVSHLKSEYLEKKFGCDYKLKNLCFCCDYSGKNCQKCPIIWNWGEEPDCSFIYETLCNAVSCGANKDYITALARTIANFPTN